MKVSDLLKRLAIGELNNLHLASTGVIQEEKIPQILMYLNEGLLRLHTRFLLREKSLVIQMREEVTNYHLVKKFALSQYDPENPPASWNKPYILDLSHDNFEGDVIKILSVYDYTGTKLPINDIEDSMSVFTPQPNILQIPFPVQDLMMGVEYQARHPIIPDEDYSNIEVEIPECLESALQCYIAGKVYSHMNTQENSLKGQEYLMLFEASCQEVVDRDLVSETRIATNSRFEKRGWV